MPNHIAVPNDIYDLFLKDKKDGYFTEVERQVFLPPDGDMTNEEIRSADAVITYTEGVGTVIRLFFKLSNEEIKALQGGAVLEVSQAGDHLHPLGLELRKA